MRRTRPRIKLPFKLIGLVALAVILLLIGVLKVAAVLKDLDYFRIKEIITSDKTKEAEFSYLLGRNIFALDLKKESGYIAQLYPTYKKVNLVRILPNRLFIGLRERRPVAYVKLYRYFSVDSDLVLLSGSPNPQDLRLPIVTGLETKIIGAKAGKQYNVKELALALNIIQGFQSNNTLKNYVIKRIDMSNPYDIKFLVSFPCEAPIGPKRGPYPAYEFLEVRIGQADTAGKLRILAQLLAQLRSDLANIKYIDLKFKDPVIKFKDDKNK